MAHRQFKLLVALVDPRVAYALEGERALMAIETIQISDVLAG